MYTKYVFVYKKINKNFSLLAKVFHEKSEKSLSRGHLPTIFPKIQNHDMCLLHIQDATGKTKLGPDRSGNIMVSPEKSTCPLQFSMIYN